MSRVKREDFGVVFSLKLEKTKKIMPQCLSLSPSSCCSHSDEARGVQLGAQSLLNTHVHKSETPAEALRSTLLYKHTHRDRANSSYITHARKAERGRDVEGEEEEGGSRR